MTYALPAWVVGENVAGIVNMALDQVCADLENEGYAVQAFIIPACAVDAPSAGSRWRRCGGGEGVKMSKMIAKTEGNLVYAKRKLDQTLQMKEHRRSEKFFRDEIDYNNSLLEILNFGPCALCMYNPPSSMDGKPCVMCPAQRINMED